MKKLNPILKNLLKGATFGAIISAVANLITMQDFMWINVLVGTILGVFVYLFFECKWK